jgi:hypothetical protein
LFRGLTGGFGGECKKATASLLEDGGFFVP